MKRFTRSTCLAALLSTIVMVDLATADLVVYDFDSDLSGSVTGGATAGALGYTKGTNADNPGQDNAARGRYSLGAASDDLFAINARASDNKGTDHIDLAIGAGDGSGAASFLSFSLNPNAGLSLDFSSATLDFSSATLDFASVLYRDNTGTFDMAYRVFADTGSGFSAVGATDIHSGSFGAGGISQMLEPDGSVATKAGWNLTGTSIGTSAQAESFSLASLGALSTDQSVTFAIAFSGIRDNHFNFGSSVDDVSVNNFSTAAVPEPSSLTLLGIAALAGVLRRRRRSTSKRTVGDSSNDTERG